MNPSKPDHNPVFKDRVRRLAEVVAVFTFATTALVHVLLRATPLDHPIALIGPAQSVPTTFFGMHIHGIDVPRPDTGRVTAWPDIPFGAWRLHDANVKWSQLEPSRGTYDFARLDKYVALAKQRDVKVLLPLFGTPRWASARPNEPADEGVGSAAEPANMDDWSEFVRVIATRYKGKIEAYEIWNEPNLAKHFWSGSTDQLLEMTRRAYGIIKAMDPKAMVVLPSPTTETGPAYLDEFLSKGGAKYGDVVGYHFYVHARPPEAMVDVALRVKGILERHNVAKPIWNTEAGWDAPKPFASDELAAAYVARAYLCLWAAGIQRFYWFSWDDRSWVTIKMTELRNEAVSDTSAAKAYSQVQKWMQGAVVHLCKAEPQGVWTCQLERSGKPVWIVWDTNASAAFAIRSGWHVSTQQHLLGPPQRITQAQLQIGPVPTLLN